MNRLHLCLTAASLFAAAAVLITTPLRALPTDAPDSGNIVSPEVSPDHKITFRLKAPGAATVRITGDFALNGVAMAKDANGIWSYTTPELKTAIWGYTFNVDGVRIPDPGNLFISSGTAHLKSYVEVKGDKDHPDFWEERDVPHGIVSSVRYTSKDLGPRRVMVYTPPGYDAAAAKTYPVIYLHHAATDNETFWFEVGRANFIMDNLLADKKATPAIVVSCWGHPTNLPFGPEDADDGSVYYTKQINAELINNIIPLIEKEYRTGKQTKDRAILGFSGMGGCQALTIGLNNPGTFAYIASFSAGWRNNQNLDLNFKAMLADVEKSKKAFTRVLVKVGADETGNVTPSQSIDRYLTSKAIPHELVIVPAGIHSWVSWRGYFKDFMSEIFKD